MEHMSLGTRLHCSARRAEGGPNQTSQQNILMKVFRLLFQAPPQLLLQLFVQEAGKELEKWEQLLEWLMWMVKVDKHQWTYMLSVRGVAVGVRERTYMLSVRGVAVGVRERVGKGLTDFSRLYIPGQLRRACSGW